MASKFILSPKSPSCELRHYHPNVRLCANVVTHCASSRRLYLRVSSARRLLYPHTFIQQSTLARVAASNVCSLFSLPHCSLEQQHAQLCAGIRRNRAPRHQIANRAQHDSRHAEGAIPRSGRQQEDVSNTRSSIVGYNSPNVSHPNLSFSSHVQFSIASAQEIQQESHIRVLSKNLYSHGREPVSYGVLDRRMVSKT